MTAKQPLSTTPVLLAHSEEQLCSQCTRRLRPPHAASGKVQLPCRRLFATASGIVSSIHYSLLLSGPLRAGSLLEGRPVVGLTFQRHRPSLYSALAVCPRVNPGHQQRLAGFRELIVSGPASSNRGRSTAVLSSQSSTVSLMPSSAAMAATATLQRDFRAGPPMQPMFVMNSHPGFLVPVNAMPSGAAMGHHHVILHPQQVPNTHLRTYVQQGYGVQPNSGQPQLQYASGFVGRVPQQMGQGQVAMPGQMMAQAQWAHQQQLGQMGLPQYRMQAQAMPQGAAGYLAMPNGLQGAGGHGLLLQQQPVMPALKATMSVTSGVNAGSEPSRQKRDANGDRRGRAASPPTPLAPEQAQVRMMKHWQQRALSNILRSSGLVLIEHGPFPDQACLCLCVMSAGRYTRARHASAHGGACSAPRPGAYSAAQGACTQTAAACASQQGAGLLGRARPWQRRYTPAARAAAIT